MRTILISIAVSFVAPILFFVRVWYVLDDDPDAVADAVTPFPSRVVAIEDDQAQPVEVSVTSAEGRRAYSQRSGGLVQEVLVALNQPIRSGMPVAVVDGTTIVAYESVVPLYRPLRRYSRGDDVSIAEDILIKLGFLDEDHNSTVVDSTFSRGIRDFNAEYGNPLDALDPANLLWVGEEPLVAERIELAAGQPFPTEGDVVVAGADPVVGLSVTTPEGDVLTQQHLEGRALDVHGTVITLAASERGDALAEIGALLGTESVQVSAGLRLREPTKLQAVPASAVTTGADGSTCLFSLEGEEIRVDLLDGEPGRAYIAVTRPDEELPREVLANPYAFEALRVCS